MSPGERREMIQPGHPKLSLSAQCRVLNISRSTLYYRPLQASAEELALMKAIDKLFTKYPFFGSRQITSWVRIRPRTRLIRPQWLDPCPASSRGAADRAAGWVFRQCGPGRQQARLAGRRR